MQKRLNEKSEKPRKNWVKYVILLLLLLLLLFLLLRFLSIQSQRGKADLTSVSDSSSFVTDTINDTVTDTIDSLAVDSCRLQDSLASLQERLDSLERVKAKKKSTIPAKKTDTVVQQDTVKRDSTTAEDSSDSVVVDSLADLCAKDTVALWVYPEPSGGLHRKTISVSMISNKECNIFYRFIGDEQWVSYSGEKISIDSTSTLQYKATDSCGNQMQLREEYYEIEVSDKESPCLPGMELVKFGNSEFCIDRYEWPNKKGVIPESYISLYQAMDSCYSVGKRLCTSEEWMLACSGPHTWSYPYGQVYERYACATHEKKVSVSGSRPECRSFFGVYDMSGSLLEWTSTRAEANRHFYYVMGGFWESGPQSGCSEKRYSYFPENQHNPVGFRCCSDLPDRSGDIKKVQKGSKR
ncbi:MAG: formylglycine-generating enzyme family protein [Fibrobacter sp.]|nr:formylglycine-generating enzyme family protein [Fibrobacter sp.]